MQLLQTSSQLSKTLNSRPLTDTGNKTTGADVNDKSHIEVEARVRVRNHPIDSSPESEPRNNLADDEV